MSLLKGISDRRRIQRISKALDIPWNTVKTVIIKWRKYGTTVTLPRTGRPTKVDEKTRRNWSEAYGNIKDDFRKMCVVKVFLAIFGQKICLAYKFQPFVFIRAEHIYPNAFGRLAFLQNLAGAWMFFQTQLFFI